MSSFTKPLIVKVQDNGKKYEVVGSFDYYRTDNEKDILSVPNGFVTDFASIPRLFWNIYPPFGKYSKGAVLHDYLYSKDCDYNYSRKDADKIFLEAMKAVKVCGFTRYLFWLCVRAFGWIHYKKD